MSGLTISVMRLRRILTRYFLLCMVLSPVLSQAQLKAFTENLAPLNYHHQGKLTGFSTELLQAMLKHADLHAEFVLQPWARSYQQVLQQPDSLIFSIARTPERIPLFEWIGPISPRRICLLKLSSRRDIQLANLTELKHYRLGLVREMASSKLMIAKNLVPDTAYDFAPTSESNIRKLMAGRVDLIVGSDWVTFYEAKRISAQADSVEVAWVLDDQSPYYFALNKQTNPLLLKKLRVAFEHLKANGSVERLRKRYLEK